MHALHVPVAGSFIPSAFMPFSGKLLLLVCGVLLLGSCSSYRYDYQQTEIAHMPAELQKESNDKFADRYSVPSKEGLTHTAPFIPNDDDDLPIPRPVPMHNKLLVKSYNLLDRSVSKKAFAELLPDARDNLSLRVDLPAEIAARTLRSLFNREKAGYTSKLDEVDENIRTDCSIVYQVTEPVKTTACIYSTLVSSYVVFMPQEKDDTSAKDFAHRVLNELLTIFA